MNSNPLKVWWKSPSTIIALAIHALLFLWLFQLEFTVEEWSRVEAKSPDNYWKDRARAMYEEKGPMGLIIWFFDKHGEAKIYYRYAKLTLNGDVDYWIQFENYKPQTDRPLPYRDILLEYQPGALVAFVPPALFSTDYESYRFWLGAWLGWLHLLNLFLCIHLIAPKPITPPQMNRMLWWSIAFLLCLGGIVVARFDHLAVTYILLSIWILKSAMENKMGTAPLKYLAFGLVVSVGVLTKIIPGLVIPAALLALLVFPCKTPNWKGAAYSLAGLTAGLILFNAGFLWLFGKGYLDSYTYHMDRGVQIESLYSGIILLVHLISSLSLFVDHSYGSYNLDSPFTGQVQLLSPLLFLVLSTIIAWRVWQVRAAKGFNEFKNISRPENIILITILFLLAFILTNKVFSPQYLIWLAALIAGLFGARKEYRNLGWIFLGITGLTQLIYPHLYNLLTDFHPALIAALNIRNALILFLFYSLIRDLPKLLLATHD